MKVSGAGIHTVSGKWGGAVLLAQRGMLGESRVILPLCWCWRRDHMSAEAAIASSRVRPAPDHTPPSGCPWLRRQTSSGLSPGTWLPKCIASADHRVQRWGEGSHGQVYSRDLQPSCPSAGPGSLGQPWGLSSFYLSGPGSSYTA